MSNGCVAWSLPIWGITEDLGTPNLSRYDVMVAYKFWILVVRVQIFVSRPSRLEQRLAHLAHTQDVVGSNPTSATKGRHTCCVNLLSIEYPLRLKNNQSFFIYQPLIIDSMVK